jgi:hypothetical protein
VQNNELGELIMTYEAMCIYVFQQEGFPDWEEARQMVSRKKEIRTARQICMYLGSVFFPSMSLANLGNPFGQDHATVIHAKKTIVNDTTTRPDFNMKVKAYLHYLRRVIVSDDANEISRQLKEREVFDKFMDVLDKMELVARVYCELTNKQIINVK